MQKTGNFLQIWLNNGLFTRKDPCSLEQGCKGTKKFDFGEVGFERDYGAPRYPKCARLYPYRGRAFAASPAVHKPTRFGLSASIPDAGRARTGRLVYLDLGICIAGCKPRWKLLD